MANVGKYYHGHDMDPMGYIQDVLFVSTFSLRSAGRKGASYIPTIPSSDTPKDMDKNPKVCPFLFEWKYVIYIYISRL